MSSIVSDLIRKRRGRQTSAEEQMAALKGAIEVGDYFGFCKKYEESGSQLPPDNLVTLMAHTQSLKGEESLPYVAKSRNRIGVWLECKLRPVKQKEQMAEENISTYVPKAEESFISYDIEMTDKQRLRLSGYISLIYSCDNVRLVGAVRNESFTSDDVNVLLVCAVNKYNMHGRTPNQLQNVDFLCGTFFKERPAWVDLACSRTTQLFPLDRVRSLDGIEKPLQAITTPGAAYELNANAARQTYLQRLHRNGAEVDVNLRKKPAERPGWCR